ncbi:MAG: recombinase RecT [Clostridia bacterium]|nr:recombinase RecT [Clostridia bacterium]
MANNTPATTQQKSLSANQPRFSVFMNSDDVKALVQHSIGQDAQKFTASILSAVSVNPALQQCKNSSILSAALLGNSLNLSPSPQLGQYYLVPFNDKNQGMLAQFILGYKGYIQLAIRSGQYKKLNVLAIKKGEVIRYDPLGEELYVNLIQDEEERENAETVGYYAMFEYINGFRKTLYWSKAKMEAHALKYSKGYQAKKGYTFWEKDFDGMAMKTMLRQLISKWGIMSIDMQTAYESDGFAINDKGEPVNVGLSVDEDGVVIPDSAGAEAGAENAETSEIPPETAAEFDFFDNGDTKPE